jgi:outer membrane protein OmpA-like peptidoglycan-associated protein
MGIYGGNMRNLWVSMIMVLLFLPSATIAAEEIVFPKSQDEIEHSLRFSDKRSVVDGQGYEIKNGKIYRVINNRRFRVRGMHFVSASDIIPRVGALIHFDFDSAEIRPDSHPLLNEFGKALKGGLKDATIIIAGHTDNIGPKEYNKKLSEERAISVKNYLLAYHGIESKRLVINGLGETKPIASNDTEDGRLKNRRVEFIRIK